MTPETLQALRKSIAKWEMNAEIDDPDEMLTSIRDCALCELFYHDPSPCHGCPVRERTGLIRCQGTPYYSVIDCSLTDEDRIEAAHAEVAFLRSLLPETSK